MTPKELFEAIGLVDDALVLEADAPAARPRPWLAVLRRAVPLAACVCVVAGAVLALRGTAWPGALGENGTASGAAYAAPRAADAAPAPDVASAPADAPQAAGGADAGGPGAMLYEANTDALAPEAAEEDGTGADAAAGNEKGTTPAALLPACGNVFYWGSQLEPELQAALWADGEPEAWQSVLAGLPAEVQPDAVPTALPVLRGGEALGEYPLLDRADAQALLLDGVFLSAEAVPRGAAAPESELPAELLYNPAGAALRVPMWAFTVSAAADHGDVVCYVPAVDLETLRELVPADGAQGGAP